MAAKYYHDIDQGTDEWHQMRLGIVTASNINTLITPTGKPAKNEKMRQYACSIAAQRLFPVVEDSFQSFDMLRGTLQEGIARDVYNENFAPVTECGFITNDKFGPVIGCSPDGLVGDDGGIEIKSRLAKFQVATIIKDEFPKEFANQVQTSLLITERRFWDFVQYSNGMPIFVKRIQPDPARQLAISAAVVEFEQEVVQILEAYKAKSADMVQTERVEFLTDDMIEGSE